MNFRLRISRVIAIFIVFCCVVSNTAKSFSHDKIDEIQIKVIDALTKNDFEYATDITKGSNDRIIFLDIIKFIKLYKSSSPSIEDLRYLLTKHDWIEDVISRDKLDSFFMRDMKSQDLLSFYKLIKNKSATARFFINESKLAQSNTPKDVLNMMGLIWANSILGAEAEDYIRAKYLKRFPLNIIEKKIRLLIINKKEYEATRFISSIISIKKKELYTNLIKATGDAELAYKIYNNKNYPKEIKEISLYFYIKQIEKTGENFKESVKLLLKADQSEFADNWWQLRNTMIRNCFREKEYELALRLAEGNPSKIAVNIFESEWLQGFIKFRLMNKPRLAIDHFLNMKKLAKTSHSKAQSYYWLGRAYGALGDNKNKEKWFHLISTQYPHYFYGQLASLEPAVTPKNTQEDNSNLYAPYVHISKKKIKELVIWLNVLYKCGLTIETSEIVKRLGKYNISPKEIDAILSNIKDLPVVTNFSKQIANSGGPLIKASYPNLGIVSDLGTKHNKALYLSIMRQESNFDQNAKSSAGAIGLMQLMAGTANKYEKILKLRNNNYKSNARTNARLGIYYLESLMEMWNKNYIMTISSYNAGENAVTRWVSEYGDPRSFNTVYQVLDWLELMPYGETRFYVKKVIENIVNYNSVIFKTTSTKQALMKALNAAKVKK